MKNFNLFLIVSFLVAMMSCKTKEMVFNPDTYDSPYIVFGNGGGFSGHVKTFYLTERGSIYIADHDQYKLLGNTEKNVAKQLFTNYDVLGFKDLNLNDPGNKYYFLEFRSKEMNHAIKWGRQPLENKNLSVYYNILLDAVGKFRANEEDK
ncbi:MAG: hypothetical protein LC107_11330 [Chitinophagales bacterium]|nr:hypothetical protein [Chitinophagales bacterium]